MKIDKEKLNTFKVKNDYIFIKTNINRKNRNLITSNTGIILNTERKEVEDRPTAGIIQQGPPEFINKIGYFPKYAGQDLIIDDILYIVIDKNQLLGISENEN